MRSARWLTTTLGHSPQASLKEARTQSVRRVRDGHSTGYTDIIPDAPCVSKACQVTSVGSPILESRMRTYLRSHSGLSHNSREGRMGQISPLIRHFSSTVYRAHQELYTPVERPPKKKSQRTNKKMCDPRKPNFYEYLDEQLAALVKRYRTPKSRIRERETLCGRLRSVVQSKFGARYDVRDMGAHLYAADVVTFPFEFHVVDLEKPQGIGIEDTWNSDQTFMSHQTFHLDALPGPYNPSALAKALQEAGFDGVFEDRPDDYVNMQYMLMEDRTISWPLFRDPWPYYDPRQFGRILRPIRLYGTNPENFTLMTAGPSIIPLVGLLQAYARFMEFLPQCVAAMHLWATSLNQPAFNPLCLALMAIRGYQRSYEASESLQKPVSTVVQQQFEETYPDPSSRNIIKVIQQWTDPGPPPEWCAANYRIDASFVSLEDSQCPRRLRRLFYDALYYSSRRWPLARDIIAIDDARTVEQYTWSLPPTGPLQPGKACCVFPRRNPLVVRDPFITTWNHAESLCGPRTAYWVFNAAQTVSLLSNRGRLPDFMGRFLPPQTVSDEAVEKQMGGRNYWDEEGEDSLAIPDRSADTPWGMPGRSYEPDKPAPRSLKERWPALKETYWQERGLEELYWHELGLEQPQPESPESDMYSDEPFGLAKRKNTASPVPLDSPPHWDTTPFNEEDGPSAYGIRRSRSDTVSNELSGERNPTRDSQRTNDIPDGKTRGPSANLPTSRGSRIPGHQRPRGFGLAHDRSQLDNDTPHAGMRAYDTPDKPTDPLARKPRVPPSDWFDRGDRGFGLSRLSSRSFHTSTLCLASTAAVAAVADVPPPLPPSEVTAIVPFTTATEPHAIVISFEVPPDTASKMKDALSSANVAEESPATPATTPDAPIKKKRINFVPKPRQPTPYMKEEWSFKTHVFNLSRAPDDVLKLRERTITQVERVIQKKFGHQYSVKVFGSTCYGVDSPQSDLDLSLFDPRYPMGFVDGMPANHRNPVYNVRLVAKTLQNAGFIKVNPVASAKVPIVKFVDPNTGLKCDLNFNERLGFSNTLLIKQYCTLSPSLRAIVVALKRWASPLGLNNSSGQKGPRTFSSYALTIMTIALWQKWKLLPNLQKNLGPLEPRAGTVFWTKTRKGGSRGKASSVACDIRFRRMERIREERELNLEELLAQWFKFWAEEHDYEGNVASIKIGGIVSRRAIVESLLEDTPQGRRSLRRATAPAANGELGPEEFDYDPELDESENALLKDLSETEESLVLRHEEIGKFPWGALSVQDPFIVRKNIVSGVEPMQIKRFRTLCKRMYLAHQKKDGATQKVFNTLLASTEKSRARNTVDTGVVLRPDAPPRVVTDEEVRQMVATAVSRAEEVVSEEETEMSKEHMPVSEEERAAIKAKKVAERKARNDARHEKERAIRAVKLQHRAEVKKAAQEKTERRREKNRVKRAARAAKETARLEAEGVAGASAEVVASEAAAAAPPPRVVTDEEAGQMAATAVSRAEEVASEEETEMSEEIPASKEDKAAIKARNVAERKARQDARHEKEEANRAVKLQRRAEMKKAAQEATERRREKNRVKRAARAAKEAARLEAEGVAGAPAAVIATEAATEAATAQPAVAEVPSEALQSEVVDVSAAVKSAS